MTLRSAARTLAATALIALSVWATQRAIHIGWASYQSIEARALLGHWIARPGPIDQLVWNRAREGFVTALEWDPGNPVYHEGFANLYMVRLPISLGLRDRAQLRPYFELALRHYLTAAALRPTWPYTHASIAAVKWQLDQHDADFRRAIVLASRYGPWEAPIHDRLIQIGYRSWATLGETEREAIRGNLRRAHQYRPQETGRLLAGLRTVAPPCAELRVDVPDACTPAAGVPGGTATRERLPG